MDASGRVKVEHEEHGCLQFISSGSSLGWEEGTELDSSHLECLC